MTASAATTVAIVPAAGKGLRMGQDKALLDLGGSPAIARIAAAVQDAGIDQLIVVRAAGAAVLPPLPRTTIVEVSGDGDMADSLRAAAAALPASCEVALVLPVDHALVAADTIAAVAAAATRTGRAIALPLFRGRPGHPVALRRAAFAELSRPGATLRDVVRADPSRTVAVPTNCSHVLADLDRPEDLRAARAALAALPLSPVELMWRHRSRRSYAPTPIADEQLERLVDAARYASTSSFIQAYAVVAVRDAVRKSAVGKLCSNQRHIDEAPLFVAICADLHKLDVACRDHSQMLQTGSLELFLQSSIDAALLAQNLALAAESEGLGICMIGAARNQPVELARLLELPRSCAVLFGMTIGVPTDDPLPRGRMPIEGVLHRERYDAAAIPEALAGADAAMRAWARRLNEERGGQNGKPVNADKGWTERMAQQTGAEGSYLRARASLRDELRDLGFGLE